MWEGIGSIRLQADIIATTNKNLAVMCEEKTFRSDLYYRLAMLEIHIPPLRERPGDIPLLLRHFMESYAVNFRLSEDALDYLCRYPWPGNVRQLKHLIVRLSILYPEETVTPKHLDEYFQINDEKKMSIDHIIKGNSQAARGEKQTVSEEERMENGTEVSTLAALEKNYIRKRLEANEGNIMKTAKELGVARNTLYSKMQKYGL